MWLKFHGSHLPDERRDVGKNGSIINRGGKWILQRMVWFAALQQPHVAVAASTMLWFGLAQVKIN
jgi:hypothetical protein